MSAPATRGPFRLVRLIALFFDQLGAQRQIECPLDHPALVIALVNRTRQFDESFVEAADAFVVADAVLDLPQAFIQGLEPRRQRRSLGAGQHRSGDLAQQAQFPCGIGSRRFGRQPFDLDLQDGDLVDQFAPGGGYMGNAHRGTCACISAKTPAQSPSVFCRNNFMLGYHGLSLRPRNQRQSGTCFKATQTGRPSAPARCASAESKVITRSRLAITAALSRKASGSLSKSSPKHSTWGRVANCSAPKPLCRLISRTPGSADRPSKQLSGTARLVTPPRAPCQEMPILKPLSPVRAAQRAIRSGSAAR